MSYRHEYKYIISDVEAVILQERLKHLMALDTNVNEEGYYNIRSLYFDDYQDSCYFDNESGYDPREKFRIRIYNHSKNYIVLECKRKERGKTLKTSCLLTVNQCESFSTGMIPSGLSDLHPLLRKLILFMQERLMHPVVIVEYDRIPYVYNTGNVRITLDKNIASSSELLHFLSNNISKRAVMPRGFHILEVKWDDFIPDDIFCACQLESLRQTSCSKYYLCRQYHL